MYFWKVSTSHDPFAETTSAPPPGFHGAESDRAFAFEMTATPAAASDVEETCRRKSLSTRIETARFRLNSAERPASAYSLDRFFVSPSRPRYCDQSIAPENSTAARSPGDLSSTPGRTCRIRSPIESAELEYETFES